MSLFQPEVLYWSITTSLSAASAMARHGVGTPLCNLSGGALCLFSIVYKYKPFLKLHSVSTASMARQQLHRSRSTKVGALNMLKNKTFKEVSDYLWRLWKAKMFKRTPPKNLVELEQKMKLRWKQGDKDSAESH